MDTMFAYGISMIFFEILPFLMKTLCPVAIIFQPPEDQLFKTFSGLVKVARISSGILNNSLSLQGD